MYKFRFIFLFLGLVVSACVNEPFEEPQPHISWVQLEGLELFIQGTVDGEPFRFDHISMEEYSQPVNDGEASSAHPFFGTAFVNRKEGQQIELIFGITESGNDALEQVIRPGFKTWYGFEVPSPSRGEAFVPGFRWRGVSYTSPLGGASNSPENEFEITRITPVEPEAHMDARYRGNLYKVEGSFKTLLDAFDTQEQEQIPLVVESFSALFYDDSP